jgi:hypothetical protein
MKLTTQDVIREFKKVRGDKYDYSKKVKSYAELVNVNRLY